MNFEHKWADRIFSAWCEGSTRVRDRVALRWLPRIIGVPLAVVGTILWFPTTALLYAVLWCLQPAEK